MKAVLRFLEKVDPEAARRARERYACFDQFGEDTQVYGFVAGTGLTRSCEEVVSQLVELRHRTTEYARRDGQIAEDEVFDAEQNARLVKNAEAYYRSMLSRGGVVVESARPPHGRDAGGAARASRATARARQDRRVGAQLAPGRCAGDGYESARRAQRRSAGARALQPRRRADRLHHLSRHGHGRLRVGAPAERKRVRPRLAGSYEALFHAARPDRFLLTWRGEPATKPCVTRGSNGRSG